MNDPCKCCKCNNPHPDVRVDGVCVCWVLCDTCGNMGKPALSKDKACENWQRENENKTK